MYKTDFTGRSNCLNVSEDCKLIKELKSVSFSKSSDSVWVAVETCTAFARGIGNLYLPVSGRHVKTEVLNTRRPASADRTARVANFRRDLKAT